MQKPNITAGPTASTLALSKDNAGFRIEGATFYTNVNSELVIGGLVEGYIYRSTGEPLASAEVVAYWREGEQWRSGIGAFTDASGYYQLPALVYDTYRLGIAAYVGHPTKEFYDNAGGIETARDIVVRAGKVTQAYVVIGPQQTVTTFYLPLLQR